MTILRDPMVDDDQEAQEAEDGLQPESDVQYWRTSDSRTTGPLWQGRFVQVESARRADLIRTTRLIWIGTTILEFLLATRFMLKLMAANPEAAFAVFMYNVTGVFLAPFYGLTATPSSHGAVLETPTIIAMIIYAIWTWLIVRIIWIVFEEPAIK